MSNKQSFTISEIFNVPPETIYEAWLGSETHSNMTGGKATASHLSGAEFSAWDDYITGKNIELVPNKKIVQSWRTTDFKSGDADSKISLFFEQLNEGTKLTLVHEDLPKGQPDYEQGWKDHYFEPMKLYFSR